MKPIYMWEGSGDLVKNIEGPPMYFDFFHVKYKHYTVKGGYAEMSKLIAGLIFAYQAISPREQELKKDYQYKNTFCQPVYLVWRSFPGENLPIDGQDHPDEYYKNVMWTDCRFNIYTKDQWDFNNAELEFRQSKKEVSPPIGDNMDKFKEELTNLINIHSIENLCDMPDFLLADMICAYLVAFGPVSKQNLDWHGCDSLCHPRCGPPTL